MLSIRILVNFFKVVNIEIPRVIVIREQRPVPSELRPSYIPGGCFSEYISRKTVDVCVMTDYFGHCDFLDLCQLVRGKFHVCVAFVEETVPVFQSSELYSNYTGKCWSNFPVI